MIIYQSRFLTRGEVWFDNDRSPARVDWIVYHQRSQPAPKARWRPFYTRLIDLLQTPEALMSQMDGFTAADIRKAQKKDLTVCQRLDSAQPGVLSEFCAFYDGFAVRKHLAPVDRHWLERTAEAGKLGLWAANGQNGDRLVFHLFYLDRNRVRSMHAPSLQVDSARKEDQRKIGRANRLLIWESMLHYRNHGIEKFDLGGWYNGTTDQARLGINKFKEGLGGKVVCEYEGEQILTLKAWGAVNTARLIARLKERRQLGKVQEEPSSQSSASGRTLATQPHKVVRHEKVFSVQ
jgi:hypothetical protein